MKSMWRFSSYCFSFLRELRNEIVAKSEDERGGIDNQKRGGEGIKQTPRQGGE